MLKPKFKSQAENKSDYDYLSVSMLKGEKDKLVDALNKGEHPHSSLSQLIRASVNEYLKGLQIKFKLTV